MNTYQAPVITVLGNFAERTGFGFRPEIVEIGTALPDRV
ncbi:lasso RiPP family leader peptide-containing protein [Mobilicoccus caccae]|nr:lasso RiPP family leader peptide-containing protein [Mobilicoccus caccae]